MLVRLPSSKSIITLLALAALSTGALVGTAQAESSVTAAATNQRAQFARIIRGLASLRDSLRTLSTTVANQKPAAATTPAPEALTIRAPIGPNQPTNGWVTFDFYPGRTPEAVSYHNATSIGVGFRIMENGKAVQTYKLDFPFAGRPADELTADMFIIQNCVNDFYRAASTDGGSFFLQVSSDPKLGVVCSSRLYD